MKLINREFYLNQLIDVMQTPDIKVITGIRRAGKSKLMEAFINYVKETIIDANIIHIDFRSTDYDELTNKTELENHIKSQYKKGVYNLVCIDEVQMCNGFEKAINSLYTTQKYDIYITGSNAFLLSSDLATLFTGTSIEIHVYPFSFAEYVQYYESKDIDAAFDSYAIEGGMSGSYVYKNYEKKFDYIKSIYNTIIKRDLIDKENIKNELILKETSNFLMSNIGSITSIRNIADTFIKNKSETNNTTIGKYVSLLCKSFLFYVFPRYDVAGLKYISSSDKYYLADHSFRYAQLGTKRMDYGHIYENIIAMELLRRGYEVYVGKLYKKEIDFVAIKRDKKIYLQVSDNIENQETFEREISPLMSIKDSYPKTIIARTKHEDYDYNGIRIYDIAHWLIKED